MTLEITAPASPVRPIWRSVGAVSGGFVAIYALTTATDHMLHVLAVYPPLGEPLHDPALNALALFYRSLFGIIGGYIAARLAPKAGLAHAIALGLIGTLLSAMAAFTAWDLALPWYVIGLAIVSLPTTWAGGFLAHRLSAR